ncbi:MAG: YidC/Oxa1 family membrane protein insertase [Herpetosiphon sp.]
MSQIWQPFVSLLTNTLLWLTHMTGNLGSAIIIFTILTRIVLFPLTWKQLKSSRKLQELQPLMAELRRKYGKDNQRLTAEMTKLYKENNANPVGGCLPLVVQLPIFIGVYRAIIDLTTKNGDLPHQFFWIPNLTAHDPFYILPVITIFLQLIGSVMAMPKIQDPQQKATSQAMLIMPIMFGIIYLRFNAGAVLYWATGATLQVIQQFFVTGWGSLTNYLPFLPERTGLLAPVAAPSANATVIDGQVEPIATEAPAARSFWTPLQKLQSSPASGEVIDATPEDKQQGRQRKGSR